MQGLSLVIETAMRALNTNVPATAGRPCGPSLRLLSLVPPPLRPAARPWRCAPRIPRRGSPPAARPAPPPRRGHLAAPGPSLPAGEHRVVGLIADVMSRSGSGSGTGLGPLTSASFADVKRRRGGKLCKQHLERTTTATAGKQCGRPSCCPVMKSCKGSLCRAPGLTQFIRNSSLNPTPNPNPSSRAPAKVCQRRHRGRRASSGCSVTRAPASAAPGDELARLPPHLRRQA